MISQKKWINSISADSVILTNIATLALFGQSTAIRLSKCDVAWPKKMGTASILEHQLASAPRSTFMVILCDLQPWQTFTWISVMISSLPSLSLSVYTSSVVSLPSGLLTAKQGNAFIVETTVSDWILPPFRIFFESITAGFYTVYSGSTPPLGTVFWSMAYMLNVSLAFWMVWSSSLAFCSWSGINFLIPVAWLCPFTLPCSVCHKALPHKVCPLLSCLSLNILFDFVELGGMVIHVNAPHLTLCTQSFAWQYQALSADHELCGCLHLTLADITVALASVFPICARLLEAFLACIKDLLGFSLFHLVLDCTQHSLPFSSACWMM